MKMKDRTADFKPRKVHEAGGDSKASPGWVERPAESREDALVVEADSPGDPLLLELAHDLQEAFGGDRGERSSHGLLGAAKGKNGDGAVARQTVAGVRIGDFAVFEEIGRGGMGVVYRARQLSLNRDVALKVLPAAAYPTEKDVARFQRESKAAARLHHTNIVPVYAQGCEGGTYFYAMEWIEGESLDAALRSDSSATSLTLEGLADSVLTGSSGFLDRKSGTRSEGPSSSGRLVAALPRTRADYHRIAALVAEVCDGVEHAHQAGILHRDLKPQNLLLGRDNRLHVTDFGLSKGIEDWPLTLDGEIMGTPAYMSPEQAGVMERPVDHRTDVYALGATLYEVLTLRRPFEGRSKDLVLHRLATMVPPRPRKLDRRIPLDLDTICMRALEKEPSHRFPSAAAMAVELRRFSEGRPILTRRTSWVFRVGKWARRRKAVAAALALLTITVGVSAALAVNVSASRRQQRIAREREARWHLEGAHNQLIYLDYKNSASAMDDLNRAQELGADLNQVLLLRAIAARGASNYAVAWTHVERVLELDPHHRAALYVLAWIHEGREDRPPALKAFDSAEQIPGERSAEEYFLRGLACHRFDPELAAESFEEARRLVLASQKKTFSQAILHLARANNQTIYRTRRTDRFQKTDQLFRRLIEEGVYGSYPYYLLSITHRRVGEIHADVAGVGSETAQRYFQTALELARTGQEVDGPEPDRPITAEAECHESLGDYAAAIEARTRAIAVAAEQAGFREEGYGYRWRLWFWLGELDRALEDLGALSRIERNDFKFKLVYPSLVHADAGRLDQAIEMARLIGPESPSTKHQVWRAACLRLLGQAEEADRFMADAIRHVRKPIEFDPRPIDDWDLKLLEFSAGRLSLEHLLMAAVDRPLSWQFLAEAYFHAATVQLARGDRIGALDLFEKSYRSFDKEPGYTYDAKIFLVRMGRDPAWPPWIPN
jgi:serine/threonine protein kinase